jgi:hypothetical protein
MKYYPNNTLTSFVTRLQKTITLSGDWEVALSEFHFPRSWYTIKRGGVIFSTQCDDYVSSDVVRNPSSSITILLPGGYYDTITDLVSEMNSGIRRVLGGLSKIPESLYPVVKYNEVSKKVAVALPRKSSVQLPEPLKLMLGIGTTSLNNRTDGPVTRYGSEVGDVNGGIHGLYVYCDLAESVPVGDVEAPLLRVVSAKGKNGEMQQRNFDQLSYIPVQKKNFDSVEIFIRDDLGNPIPFESGKLLVTLHFRRVKNPYFL